LKRPLAEFLRPQQLDDYFGQDHILGKDQSLRDELASGQVHSMILWGPPGTGKTTLANIISQTCDANFICLSAVLSGVKDIRIAIEQAKENQQYQKQTVLFVDEVHRFNKSQQDAFLPHIESGLVIFIGATTENPSFELNNALLSRCSVYVLKKLDDPALNNVLQRAIEQVSSQYNKSISFSDEAKKDLFNFADGDARKLLNIVEIIAQGSKATEIEITAELLAKSNKAIYRSLGKKGDVFYDQISALHKAVRGTDPDAALYWFCRMIDGGCDPLYVARRLVRIASEDIGNADPRALEITLNASSSYKQLGSPEGELALAQAVIYIASCAKSNAVYMAYKQAMAQVKASKAFEVPKHLRNAPTRLMKDLGMGENYRYAHDEPEGYAAGENYFPDEMQPQNYYQPVARGLEIKIKERLDYLKKLK